ncbi:hypothetical protein C8D97_10547 [Pleionea mediterranea]|uniref:Uncharacterized protein n=2 Tax=Pleionea mediterranea TaxID=523701 RepID=A0A316FTY7_9GAMM|nr:hypothetical protein C8D97_10547 [Pleionea mediterranea]
MAILKNKICMKGAWFICIGAFIVVGGSLVNYLEYNSFDILKNVLLLKEIKAVGTAIPFGYIFICIGVYYFIDGFLSRDLK